MRRVSWIFLCLGASGCCPAHAVPAREPAPVPEPGPVEPASSTPAPEPSQSGEGAEPHQASTEPAFDAQWAQRLGADEYGMRRYVLAFLRAGPRRDQSAEVAAQIQRAHLDNINRLADSGKLVLAGPFMDDGDLRGIYVFAVETVAEAQALTATDPAVVAERLVMELHPWYGSAALGEINALHKRISAKKH